MVKVMNNESINKHIFYIILAICFLATGGIFVKLSSLPPIATGFYRILFSIPLLYPFVKDEIKKIEFKNIILIILAGIFLALDLIFWNISFSFTTVANANLLANLVPFPYKDENAIWWLNYIDKNEGKNGIFRAIVIDGVICGNISIEKKEDIYCKEGTLGYFLLTEYWGKGIMTKVTGKICQIAFKELNIVKISATTFNKNIASQKVLEKNNFDLEGIRKKSNL